jgi:hypothetical protein
MRVTTVSVNVRYSKPMGDGAHKTVELGIEGSLTDSSEDWCEVQRNIYAQLGDQLRYVFNGNGSGKAQNGSEKPIRGAHSQPEPQTDRHCRQHQTPFKQYTKDGRSWWSHRHSNGWCKES